jgi:hypothetical protein
MRAAGFADWHQAQAVRGTPLHRLHAVLDQFLSSWAAIALRWSSPGKTTSCASGTVSPNRCARAYG